MNKYEVWDALEDHTTKAWGITKELIDDVYKRYDEYTEDEWRQLSGLLSAIKWHESYIRGVQIGRDTFQTISPGFYADLILWLGYFEAQKWIADLDKAAV